MLENPSSTHPDFDETWRRLESLVDEVAQWAKNADSFAEFYGVLLQRAVTDLKVAGGAIWNLDSARRLQRIDMIGSPAIDVMTQRPSHLDEVLEVFRRGTETAQSDAESVPMRAEPGREARSTTQSSASASDLTSCMAPVIVDDEVVAVFEFVLAAETAAANRENTEHVMAALADVSVDFHRAAQLRDLRQQVAAWNSAQAFSDCVHRRLDLDETCYAIANEGRRFIGADRVSVLVARGRSLHVRAISGVEGVDRRSPEVIILRKLAKAVAQFGEPVWTQDAIDQPPQIQQLLDAYHDTSGASCLAIIPITSEPIDGNSRASGVLVVEQFKGDKFEYADKERVAICVRHARTALANALEMHSLPLLWVSRGVRSVGHLFGFQSISMFVLVVVVAMHLVGGVIATLCFVSTDFTITARGQLQPVEQQDIFAPTDGVVEETFVQDGDEVRGGEVLVKLRNTELDYETERLLGELATTRAKRQAVQAARAMGGRDQVLQHDAEIERLKQVLTGLERQYDILVRQHKNLAVRASFKGQVMSWEADKSLVSRPVRQGQRLMTIANLRGRWRLEVDVADDVIGHVLDARRKRGDDELPVTFILLTDPATAHRGAVADVGLATVVTGNREPTVRVTVDIESDDLTSPRPGAGVVAHLHCGRRSIGYVWFRSFYEKLRMRTMF